MDSQELTLTPFENVEGYRITYSEASDRRNKKILTVAKITALSVVAVFIVCLIIALADGTDDAFFTGAAVMFYVTALAFANWAVISVVISLTKREEIQTALDNYKSVYKAYFVGACLLHIFDNYFYDHELGFQKSRLSGTGLVNTGDRFSSNDYVSGLYHDFPFEQSDVRIDVEETDSDGSPYVVSIFRGRWMIFRLKKKFEHDFVVSGKSFGMAVKLPFMKTSRQEEARTLKFKKISLESEDFNKTFYIYGEDEVEVRYLLDPAFMERFKALAKRYNNAVMLMIAGNELHIAVNDWKDSFEPPVNPKQSLDEKTEFIKVLSEIHTVTDVVDSLKLK